MPYKSEKIKLQGLQDRRRKLTDEQKIEIKEKYIPHVYSLAKLAREYGVSKASILLIVNEESKKRNDKYLKEHWKEFQQPREEHTKAIREHRRYKQKLYLEGKLNN